jgi:hypothetical protein
MTTSHIVSTGTLALLDRDNDRVVQSQLFLMGALVGDITEDVADDVSTESASATFADIIAAEEWAEELASRSPEDWRENMSYYGD